MQHGVNKFRDCLLHPGDDDDNHHDDYHHHDDYASVNVNNQHHQDQRRLVWHSGDKQCDALHNNFTPPVSAWNFTPRFPYKGKMFVFYGNYRCLFS